MKIILLLPKMHYKWFLLFIKNMAKDTFQNIIYPGAVDYKYLYVA